MELTIMTLALGIIRQVVKNPAKKARLKKRMLQVRDAISAAYPDE